MELSTRLTDQSILSVGRFDDLYSRRFFQLSDFRDGFHDRARAFEQWGILADRFDGHELSVVDPSAERIPQRIHQIWLGSRLPEKYREWTDSWRRVNKGWQYRLWDEEAILRFGLKNEDAFRRSLSLGTKSDIARYEILEREGGVYADTDFECLLPLNDLALRCTFFAGTIFDDAPQINNGLMGCVPGHPLLRHLIGQLSVPIRTKDTGIVLESSGPVFLTRNFFANLATTGARDVIFPTTFFYPFPNFVKKEFVAYEQMRAYAREWSIAVHYWETSWARPHPLRRLLSQAKRRLLGLPAARV
jgi:hypothetical protein